MSLTTSIFLLSLSILSVLIATYFYQKSLYCEILWKRKSSSLSDKAKQCETAYKMYVKIYQFAALSAIISILTLLFFVLSIVFSSNPNSYVNHSDLAKKDFHTVAINSIDSQNEGILNEDAKTEVSATEKRQKQIEQRIVMIQASLKSIEEAIIQTKKADWEFLPVSEGSKIGVLKIENTFLTLEADIFSIDVELYPGMNLREFDFEGLSKKLTDLALDGKAEKVEKSLKNALNEFFVEVEVYKMKVFEL